MAYKSTNAGGGARRVLHRDRHCFRLERANGIKRVTLGSEFDDTRWCSHCGPGEPDKGRVPKGVECPVCGDSIDRPLGTHLSDDCAVTQRSKDPVPAE